MCARAFVCVWRKSGKEELSEETSSLCLFSKLCGRMRRSDKYVYVWDGKAGRENFVKQLLEFSVNWAELCPVI